MRVTAILGPAKVSGYLKEFQRVAGAEWTSAPPLPNQADAVVIFGGDGTIHRYLPALVDLRLPVLVVPCGSGNDFARALKLRSVSDSLEAWRRFLAGRNNVRIIDLGIITSRVADETTAPHQHYFCCVAGVGIDTAIARRANQLPKWIRAHGGYALCAPRELFRFAPSLVKVSRDGAAADFNPTILAAFANSPTFGGGMKIAPGAKLDDGKLDICVVRAMQRFKLFCLFPTVYFGKHLSFNEVEYEQTTSASLETDHPVDVYADGEYICQTPIELSVATNALRVIVSG